MLLPIYWSHLDVVAARAGVEPHSATGTHVRHICDEAHRRAAVLAAGGHYLPPSLFLAERESPAAVRQKNISASQFAVVVTRPVPMVASSDP
jgi:hypothetical protein